MASPGEIDQLLQDPRIWQAGRSVVSSLPAVATGWPRLDQALGGGWPLGQLTELLIDAHGVGELTLLLPALGALIRRQGGLGEPAGWLALVSPPYLPYAPALARAHVDPARLLVVHSRQDMDTLWAMEQALRSGTCAAVVGWSGSVAEAPLRRLQLAAEAGNCWTVLFRPAHCRSSRSPAPLRIHLSCEAAGGRLALGILKRRGGPPVVASVDPGR